MNLDVQLSLEHRGADRLRVSVWVRPLGEPVSVDSITLELLGPTGDEVGPRLLLPIAGTLGGPIATTVEVRGYGEIPPRSTLRAVAWVAEASVVVDLPADPPPDLGDWMCGRGCCGDPDLDLRSFTDAERARWARYFPWTAPAPTANLAEVLEPPSEAHEFSDLGLDDETAQWVSDLMNEDL